MSATTSSRQYFYSAGRRKTATARVKLFDNGSGDAKVNNMDFTKYFAKIQNEVALSPLALIQKKKDFDIEVRVVGGGKSAQADAIRLGISRALLLFDPDLRPTLKREGYIRRDARVKERKKPGLKRARRAPQFSKR